MNIWNERNILVVGLGQNGGGVGTVRYMLRYGADVEVTDLKSAERLHTPVTEIRESERGDEVTFHLGTNEVGDLLRFDYILKNPAVPYDAPLIRAAYAHNIPVMTDVEIFFQEIERQYASRTAPTVIGVTGTRGKSTTTALVYEIVRTAGYTAYLGGNIGTSMLDILPELTADSVVVLELSSFQLENSAYSPHIAIMTNLFPDHLDRHRTMKAYREAKANIIRHQTSEDWAILNADNARIATLAKYTEGQVALYSAHSQTDYAYPVSVWLQEETIWSDILGETICTTSDIALPGHHNLQNVLAAVSAASILGVSAETQARVLATFHGLPNRLEIVGTKDGVKFVNDTTSTMPEATVAALEVFRDAAIHLIAGGESKDVSYEDLIRCLETYDVQTVVLLPGSASDILRSRLSASDIRLHMVDDLFTAVHIAADHAEPEEVVLFSPAATSFASFENEFARGEAFREAVRARL